MPIQKLDKKLTDKAQYVIEVVSFNGTAPQLIKQQYYKDEDGNWLPGKLKGFTFEDLKFLKNKEERTKLFEVLEK